MLYFPATALRSTSSTRVSFSDSGRRPQLGPRRGPAGQGLCFGTGVSRCPASAWRPCRPAGLSLGTVGLAPPWCERPACSGRLSWISTALGPAECGGDFRRVPVAQLGLLLRIVETAGDTWRGGVAFCRAGDVARCGFPWDLCLTRSFSRSACWHPAARPHPRPQHSGAPRPLSSS